jgi:hypothetical protein
MQKVIVILLAIISIFLGVLIYGIYSISSFFNINTIGSEISFSINSGKESIKIGTKGIHVKTGNENIDIGNDGIEIITDKEKVNIGPKGILIKEGEEVININIEGLKNKFGYKKNEGSSKQDKNP